MAWGRAFALSLRLPILWLTVCSYSITEPARKARGIRHDLAAILAVVVVARLSGADSAYAAAQFAATMPQEALARCGIR
jgi:DDE_Tnp_1-associated